MFAKETTIKTNSIMKRILLPLALMSALLVSCEKPENKEPEYEISISPTELIFGAERGEQTVTITSSAGWYSMDYSSDWCEVFGGDSSSEVIISVSPNFEFAERECILTFYVGEAIAELKVIQEGDSVIQFKDPRFMQALLKEEIDQNEDGKISKAEASLVYELELYFEEIRIMDEIKYFTALTRLACGENQLTSLDLSNNTALTELYCPVNQLTSLDLSNNTALTELSCSDNQLTSLDLSNNTALTNLRCYSNQLTTLDLHNNRLLEYVTLDHNPLQKLILYTYHNIYNMFDIESEYGDIIEYME